jgi:dolichol-phosphate mannosyltransferase
MTLSSHTMGAVNDQVLPRADRFMLAIRSRLHSREGRAVGHAMGRLNLPIVTINAWVQLFIPPPKYHVTSLIDCAMTDRAPLDAVILMERGMPPLAEEPAMAFTLEQLLDNTDDAYTFPPFASMAPLLRIDGLDYPSLRATERELLNEAIGGARRFRIRIAGHGWADVIPTLLARGDVGSVVLDRSDEDVPVPASEVPAVPVTPSVTSVAQQATAGSSAAAAERGR